MKDSHEIFKEAGFEAIKNAFSNNTDDKGKDDKATFALLAVLLFIGSEAVSVVFRKNFGREALNIAMIIGCSLCFGAIAVYEFYNIDDLVKPAYMGSNDSYLITGTLFSLIAIFILLRGLYHITKALKVGDFSSYFGDSSFLSFLKKDKWSDNQIRFIAEPLLVLCMGVGYCFFNLIGGIALIFCGISVWARLIVEVIILGNPISQKINEPAINASGRKSNNRVN